MKFRPAASIFTTAWPASGLGSETSSRRSASGPPGVCTRIAFMPGNLSATDNTRRRRRVPHESRVHRSRQHGTADRSARVAGGPHGHRLQPHAQPCGCAQTAPTHSRPKHPCGGRGGGAAGDDRAGANVIKLAGNFLLAAAIEGMGEAFALVRKYDVAPADLLEIVNGRLFRSPIYENYGKLIAAEQYEPAGFKLRYGLKDVRLVLGAAGDVAAPIPLARLIPDPYLSGLARGWGDIDWAGLARIAAADAGLSP